MLETIKKMFLNKFFKENYICEMTIYTAASEKLDKKKVDF